MSQMFLKDELNEDKINENNVVCELYAIFFSFYVKEKFVGSVKILQDQ